LVALPGGADQIGVPQAAQNACSRLSIESPRT